MKYMDAKLIRQTKAINLNGTSYIWFRLGGNNWFWQIPEKTTQRSTKLMQFNYSHLKILKLEIYCSSLSLVMFFCAHITWWQGFTTLTIQVFSLPFFLNVKSPIFAVSFFEKSPELIIDPKGHLFTKQQNCPASKLCYRQKKYFFEMT